MAKNAVEGKTSHLDRCESLLLEAESLLRQRQVLEALQQFDAAQRCGADADRCGSGRWHCWMFSGEWERAWQESDSIRARGASDPHRFWDGSTLDDKRVMLRCLHGYGDAVQYLRYAGMIRERAQRLVVKVAPPLVALAKCFDGIDEVITWGSDSADAEPEWDTQIEVAELPYLFRSTVGDVPAVVPYLTLSKSLPDSLIEHARSAVGSSGKLKVGLVWTGGNWDSSRSIPFRLLGGLLESEAAEFWSLQAAEDNVEWYEHCVGRNWPRRVGGEHAIEEMAAFAEQMDLVITVDTLAAHVAAALGRPTWVMLRWAADWRWMVGRKDSPWYPTMRLFRQPAEGDWETVIAEVRQELESQLRYFDERTIRYHPSRLQSTS